MEVAGSCGKLRLRGWLVFHQFAVVCLHQQQGGLFGPTVGEVEHLAAAALCQQVVDGKAAGLAIGDELDGLCAVVLQVAQGVQVAGKGGSVVGTGVGAQGAVLAHRKGLVHALSVHHPQLKGAVGVDRLALGGTAVGAGVGAVAVVLPVVAGGGDLLRLDVAALRAGMLLFTCSGAGGRGNNDPVVVGVGLGHIVLIAGMGSVIVAMPLVAGGGEHRHIRNSIAAGAVVRLLPCSSAGGCNIHCPVAPIMCVGVDGDGLRVDVVAHLAGTLLLAFGGAP